MFYEGALHLIIIFVQLFLGLFILLQLSVYLLIASTALWIDQLVNGPIAHISSHTAIYMGLFVFTLTALGPWLALGWLAVRREMRRAILVFLSIGAAYVVCWALMYYARVFRWTWLQWPFFASLTVAAQSVLAASVVLGVLCRARFGAGLKHYLRADAALAKDDFEPEIFGSSTGDDIEKRRPSAGDDRFSLDFGARQPPPPMSPPAYPTTYSTPPAPPVPALPNSISRVHPLARVAPPASAARPESYTVVLPSLPTLGKNDPWSEPRKAEEEGFGF